MYALSALSSLPRAAQTLPELVLQRVLLAALALAALADEQIEQGLGLFPLLAGDVLVDERHGRLLVLGIGLVARPPTRATALA